MSKIFVGMSGGVDSSVSAALLHKAGHDVTGVFIRVWQPDWMECDWREERLDAMRAAAHIGIPFVTLDLAQEYKKGVIDYMIAEYKAGRTPNPDVMCNREVKFGAFWKWAKEQGAAYIATGHYAQSKDGRLLISNDLNKDQTYFLWTLNKSDLAHVLFPIGHMTKPEVRELAATFKLPNADKKDSQGLCFIGKVDLKEFLKHYIETKDGDVLNEKGEVIGTHPGALLFTIGERHGFIVMKKTPDDEPYYVISKDNDKNTITVSNKSDDKTAINKNNKILITSTSWVNLRPKIGDRVEVRTRYRETLYQSIVSKIADDNAEITLEKSHQSITPGQSLVLYNSDECLGGGVIV